MAVAKKIVGIVVVAGVAYFAYQRFMPHGPGGGWGAGGPAPVSVAEVMEKQVQQWHDFSGRLSAVDTVDIRPRVSGTIDEVYFENGQMVKAGDKLFTIDPRPYRAALEASSARSVLAEAELKRAQQLVAEKAVPQREFDQRKNDAAVARADLTTAKLNLQYTEITAPIAGRISRAEITQGNLVEAGPNAPMLTRIVSNNPIYADFEVDEATYLQYVKSQATHGGQASKIPVSMALMGEDEFPHKGTVESFDNKLNDTSGTIRVRASFANEDGTLVPGLFARIRLGEPGPSKVLLITDRAVGTDQSKKFVLVVDKDNKAEYREITLGSVAEGLRVVTTGLKPGEKIIVNGTQRARPGAPIVPEVVPMDDRGTLDQIKPSAGKSS